MGLVFNIHSIFGERVLPVLILLAALWFAFSWRPGATPNIAARLFPVLVDIQVTLGIVYLVYRIATGTAGTYLQFPFILHPIIGILAAGIGHMAVKPTPALLRLGRWASVAPLGLLLLLVIGNVIIANVQ